MAILPVIAGMSDEQTAGGQRDGGRTVVDQIVAVGHQNWASPLIAFEQHGVRHPDRADLRAEIVLTSAGENPDTAGGVAKDAGDVVVDIGANDGAFVSFGEWAGGGPGCGGFGAAAAARVSPG